MGVKFFVDKYCIPDDGSLGVISRFAENADCDMLVFPDVHLKRNSKMANGVLISSPDNIYLACLGVENCGFTFGTITGESNEETLVEGFQKYAKIMEGRKDIRSLSVYAIRNMFLEYLSEDYEKRSFVYNYLGFSSCEEVLLEAKNVLQGEILRKAARTICTLGGGNHFFEIHKIVENYSGKKEFAEGNYVFMLHSDSISVGNIIFNLYSDLFEMKANSPRTLKSKLKILLFRIYQKYYFFRSGLFKEEYKNDLRTILENTTDYKFLKADTKVGRNLLFAHNISSLFGDMNRSAIIKNWSESQGIDVRILGSHSHDSVSVERHKGKIRIVHRNGVQYIGGDEYCILPGAMGSFSYVLANGNNEEAYYSMNHGTGRVQDKHIARAAYSDGDTINDLLEREIHLFRVGEGNLAEQDRRAFKNPEEIMHEMEKYGLAHPLAKTRPIAVIKG